MKKLLAVFLAITLLAGLLAGCSGSASSSAPAPSSPAAPASSSAPADGGEALSGKLVIWSHQNTSWNENHKKMIDRFMAENPGVVITYETYPYMDFQQKTQTSLLADEGGADIYEMWGSWAMKYAPVGALAKVPDQLAAKLKEDSYPSALGGFTVGDEYFGVPLEFNIEYGGMLVHKKLFEEKGLSYPTTWAELEKIADETSVRNGEIMEMRGFEFMTGDALTNLFLAMILSQDGAYLTDNDTKVDFSTPEAEAAMAKLVEYVRDRSWTNLEGLAMAAASDPGGAPEVFRDACMMAVVGPWGVTMGEAYGKVYGEDFDYIPLPQYGEKNAFVAETGWGFAVSEKSKQKDLAWKYVEWFSQPENMLSHNIACSQIPAYRSLSADPRYLEAMPYVKPILDILADGQFIGYLKTDVLKQEIMNTFTELVTGDKAASVADALKGMQDRINAQ